jgi:hypothetical protein
VVGCHLPPVAVGIPRAFNSRAMALLETKPAVRTSRIVERKASARMSATRVNARLLLVPPCADVSWRRRVSNLLTELRCHRPAWAPDMPLRFNSFARPHSEAKPAAISSRMVGSKTRARESAARLLANAPRVPLLPGEVFLRTGAIELPWPEFDEWLRFRSSECADSLRSVSPGLANELSQPLADFPLSPDILQNDRKLPVVLTAP